MNIHQRKRLQGEALTFHSMQHMPLSTAYLCEDCSCIGNCAEQCPACASLALMGLAGVLNRRQKEEMWQVGRPRPHGLLTAPRVAA
jgi:hypothetical protein